MRLSLPHIIAATGLVWVSVYTISYGAWTWKKKNKLGAVMVMLLALMAVIFPAYALLFRG